FCCALTRLPGKATTCSAVSFMLLMLVSSPDRLLDRSELDKTISDLSNSLSGLETSISSMKETAEQVVALPGNL
ncbi:hypothetical protein, partial [Aeromonas caviae]|uniref:hypothetical protein n=1 Tax=Aeromonas caviae TaxID=648 RepID=UPI001CC7341F